MLCSKELKHLGLIVLISSLLIIPIPFLGIPTGNDSRQHFQFALTYYDSITKGDFLLNWAAHENYGFGGIGVRFYPPIPYYTLTLMRILTGDWYNAIWLTFLFWMVAGNIGIYLLAREWLTPTNAAWTTVVFSITPFHLTHIYQSFIYAEFAAIAILPFCFAFLTRLCHCGNKSDVVVFSISLALLILTHIPTTIIGVISLGIYGALIFDWRKWLETFPKLMISFALALTATGFHWLKIVTEMSWLNHATEKFSTGHYDYKSNMFPLFFSSPADVYWRKMQWYTDVVIIFTILLILPLIISWAFNRKDTNVVGNDKKFVKASFITTLFTLLMASSLTTGIWQVLPFLQKIQFPWRWLSVASVLGAVCFVAGFVYITQTPGLRNYIAKYLLIVYLLCLMLFNITQSILPMAPYSKTDLQQKLSTLLHEESFNCWWTIWAKDSAFIHREKITISSRQFEINSWLPEERSFVVSEGKPTFARVATFYYPHWKAEVNGQPTEIKMADDGTILIPLSSEAAAVKIWFQEPIWIQFALLLSALTWLSFIGMGVLGLVRKKNIPEIEQVI